MSGPVVLLAPVLKPIITYCLLNFTPDATLPWLNSKTGFYSKLSKQGIHTASLRSLSKTHARVSKPRDRRLMGAVKVASCFMC